MKHRLATLGFAVAASAVFLGLGVSVGLYYNATYFGRAAAPLPYPVAVAAPLVYYLSPGPDRSPAAQAGWWLASFAIGGWLWLLGVRIVSRRIGRTLAFGPAVVAAALGAAALLAPSLWLAWLAARTPDGASWDSLLAACLNRQFGPQPTYLTPLFVGLACIATGLEARALGRAGECGGSRLATWLLASLAVTVGLAGLAGAVLEWVAARLP